MTRILVIEDERQVRDVLKQMLEKAGYQVDIAADGLLGLERFREHPADVVITDILMPNKDGLETIKELQNGYPDVPVIAISGGGPGEKAQYALDVARMCGAVRILAKPFSRKEIFAILDEVLAARGG